MSSGLWCNKIRRAYSVISDIWINNHHSTTLLQLRQYHLSTSLKVSLKSYNSSSSSSSSITSNWNNNKIGSRYLCVDKSAHPRALTTFHKYKAIMDVPEGIFRGNVDRFNGVTVNSADEYQPDLNFTQKLHDSLEYWKANKRRAIWFRVLTKHADWIPQLARNEFEFHHANAGYAVMCRWLPTDEYLNLPVYAHSLIGVGGLVVNDKNEVLVVSDRYALIKNSWKLPGGYVEPKEDLIEAAIREVREETGVESTFHTLISMRHSHGGAFGCSDFYIVIALKPITLELKPCEREVAKAQWMPIEEYLQHPHVHETNRHFLLTYLEYKKMGIQFTYKIAEHQVLKKQYSLFYMTKINSDKTT